ncbi:helix-turn-helix domain-containing protein [Sphingobacterium lactis]|uniref:helix-turn-helix domain-containing protein n=1 Tax=Sphingobacterium lactis TaxID=797291 RepID=UPI003EC8DC00
MVKKVYNLKYASKLLDVDRGTLYRWNKEGRIRLRFIDNMYFITHDDLVKLRSIQVRKGVDVPEVGSELRFEST